MGRPKIPVGEIEGFRVEGVIPVPALGAVMKLLFETAVPGTMHFEPAVRARVDVGDHDVGPKLLPPPPKNMTRIAKRGTVGAAVLAHLYAQFPRAVSRQELLAMGRETFPGATDSGPDRSAMLLVKAGLATRPSEGMITLTEAGIAEAKRRMVDDAAKTMSEQPKPPHKPPHNAGRGRSKSGRTGYQIMLDFVRDHPGSRPVDASPAFVAEGMDPKSRDRAMWELRRNKAVVKNPDGTYRVADTPPTKTTRGEKK